MHFAHFILSNIQPFIGVKASKCIHQDSKTEHVSFSKIHHPINLYQNFHQLIQEIDATISYLQDYNGS